MGKDVLGSGFTGTWEGARGDEIVGAGSAGRGGVSEPLSKLRPESLKPLSGLRLVLALLPAVSSRPL